MRSITEPLTDTERKLVEEGKLLPLMEEYYTLQGEGFNTGKAAYFIRMGGCDVNCTFCDTKASWDVRRYPPVSANLIIERAFMHPARAVVITGGEPLMNNLGYLTAGLHDQGFKTFLETSGSHTLTGSWDWICLSPKKKRHPLPGIIDKASELKVVIEKEEDFLWAEEYAVKVNRECPLFLQPEWSVRDQIIPVILQYIYDHPKWRISLQSHKYIGIP
jgi:7-carboxy-7-deazaguanine synthase